MKTKSILLLVLIAMIQVLVYFCICVCAHSCNYPVPGLGGVKAFLNWDWGQEPCGRWRGGELNYLGLRFALYYYSNSWGKSQTRDIFRRCIYHPKGRPITIVRPNWEGLGHLFREELSKFKWAFPCFWVGPDDLGHLFTATTVILQIFSNWSQRA